MITRLFDNLMPAFVLLSMAFLMAISFGGLGHADTTQGLRSVALERVVITAARADAGAVVAQAAADDAALVR